MSVSDSGNSALGWADFGLNTAASIGNLVSNIYYNNKQMEREDNAVQRRVADLQKVGLSKTLAAGSAANASGVSAAPHLDFKSDMLERAAAAQQMDKTDAEIAYTQALASNELLRGEQIEADTDLKRANKALADSQAILNGNSAELFGLNRRHAEIMIDKAQAEVKKILIDAGYTEKMASMYVDNASALNSLHMSQKSYYDVLAGKTEEEKNNIIQTRGLIVQQFAGQLIRNQMEQEELNFMQLYGNKMPTSANFLGIGNSAKGVGSKVIPSLVGGVKNTLGVINNQVHGFRLNFNKFGRLPDSAYADGYRPR